MISPRQFQPLAEDQILAALIQERFRRNLTMPHFTPQGWWECDLYEMTASGHWREYEVKTSRSDFNADFRKKADKHELLSNLKAGRGPREFWFATPKGMIDLEEVPDYAGLVELSVSPYGKYVREKLVKRPKKRMASPKVQDTAAMWRLVERRSYFRLMQRLTKQRCIS